MTSLATSGRSDVGSVPMWRGEEIRRWWATVRERYRRSEHLRRREHEAGQQPADRDAVLVVFVLSLAAAFLGGLVLVLVLHCE